MADISIIGSTLNNTSGRIAHILENAHPSEFVYANGALVVCLGATGDTHLVNGGIFAAPPLRHIGWNVIAKSGPGGDATAFVFIDSLPVASNGTPTTCGHAVATGEDFVSIAGE